jgi:hypothetical protein
MPTARRRRTSWAIAASIAAHLGVLVAVLLQRPTLRIPIEPSGPPEAIIPILILPRAPPPAEGRGAAPAPIQLHRRPARNADEFPPVAPLIVPTEEKPVEAPPAARAEIAPKVQAAPAPPSDAVRATLRATLGCADSKLAGFTGEERAGCAERFGRGAREDAYLAPALSAEKRAILDQAGAAKLAQKNAAERAAPSARNRPEPADYDGEPDVPKDALGPMEHKASKRAAPVLGRLPP